MKYLIYYCNLLFIIICLIFASCRKQECPDLPIKVTLGGTDFMDNTISTGSPDLNFKSYPVIAAMAWTMNAGAIFFKERALVKFNYSQIPANAIIKKATLTLYADTVTVNTMKGHSSDINTGPNTWVIRKIISDWDVNTVTWNTQPSADPSNQLIIPGSTSYKQTYVIDLTDLVAEEIKNPSKAYGFMMKLVNEVKYNSLVFASTENADTALHPKLEILYMKASVADE